MKVIEGAKVKNKKPQRRYRTPNETKKEKKLDACPVFTPLANIYEASL